MENLRHLFCDIKFLPLLPGTKLLITMKQKTAQMTSWPLLYQRSVAREMWLVLIQFNVKILHKTDH